MYGPGATRLHEEVIPVTAIWTEADRTRKPLRALGDSGEEKTLDQLEDALSNARAAPATAVARIQALVASDIGDLVPMLERIASERLAKVRDQLIARAEDEAGSLAKLLEDQKRRISKAAAEFNPDQLDLPGVAEDERRERNADRKHWQTRLARIDRELAEEPNRIRASYDVRAHRVEPIGVVYLWPASG